MKLKDKLEELQACKEAIEWVGDRDLRTAWTECERGDWMLWLHEKLYPSKRRQRVLCAGYCANTVRHLMKDERSRRAVDIAIAYGEDKASKKELNVAYAATHAAAAHSTAYAYDAARTAGAASAASAAYAAAGAAYAAAGAAYAAAGAASNAAYASARDKNRRETADICRKYLTISEAKK